MHCLSSFKTELFQISLVFSTQQHIAYMLSALHFIAHPSVCPSVTQVDQSKQLKLGLCNFHHTIAPSSSFCRVSLSGGIKKGWVGNEPFSSFKCQYLKNGRRYVQICY